ncbi:MAG: DUF6491 family protein [Brevundimonas sp.]|nr:DUF6491 family protein [Brevundimonas sp.]
MRTPVFAALGIFALLASCAPTAGGSGDGESAGGARQCFSVNQVRNYEQGRFDQVFLRVGRDDVYELNAAGGCPDMDFAQRMALIPDGGSISSRLCTYDWARVVVPGANTQNTVCRVRISRKLTAQEIAALPERHRP